MTVAKNLVVTISYNLSDTEGNLLDSSEENGNLPYIHGTSFLAPGIEKSLEGKAVGDEVDVTVPAAEAFGEYTDEMVFSVDRADILLDDDELQEGIEFEAEIKGEVRFCVVEKIEGDEVIINANHPLSGLDIHFTAKIIDIREATAEELDHGHVHDGDGHHHDH